MLQLRKRGNSRVLVLTVKVVVMGPVVVTQSGGAGRVGMEKKVSWRVPAYGRAIRKMGVAS